MRRIYRERGLRALAWLVLRRSVSPWIRAGRIHLYVRELTLPIAQPAPASGVHLRFARESEAEAVRLALEPDSSLEDLRGRFRRGDRCVVAVAEDGKLAHARWITTRGARIPELEMRVVLDPGEAYMYAARTAREFRRRGIDGMVRCFIFEHLRREGYTRLCSYVRGDNPAGLRAAERWQRPIGTLVWVALGRLRPRIAWRRRCGRWPRLES